MLLLELGELGLEAVALRGRLLGVGAELLDPAVVGCVGTGREYMWDGALSYGRRGGDGAAVVRRALSRRALFV